MRDMVSKLKKVLAESVQRNKADGLLFSGGLDTSILAAINPGIKAITISLNSHGEDIKYASSLAKFLNMEHYQKSVSVDEAIEAVPEVIRILKTFDPAIPNDVVVYFGMKLAKERGIDGIMTGDGADEIFAGYSFMEDMDEVDGYIKKISSNLQFSSNELGKSFDIKIRQPYLDREVIDFGLMIKRDLKIRRENNRVRGKWILRKAFEDILPKEVIWQDKRPLETGSGMTEIRKIIFSKISDEEFKEAEIASSRPRNDMKRKFMNKEHYYYYKIYMEEIGHIPQPKKGEKTCPGCGAGMGISAFHCRVCGNVLDWRETVK